MTDKVTIYSDDVKKSIYFIIALTQAQKNPAMQGVLSSRGDLIGGIFDRWINTIPESVIFNKIILPTIDGCEDCEIISDFYLYKVKDAGIAPDVLGIKKSEKNIPFVVFDNGWKPIENMPQIEVKSFKKKQKMITLRNQNYNNEYLIMAETDLRIDYLLPFFDQTIFDAVVKESLDMDDSVFIERDDKHLLKKITSVDNTKDELGTVRLIKITTGQNFMDTATHCDAQESVYYINSVEKVNRITQPLKRSQKLSDYCKVIDLNRGLYRFNEKMYKKFESNSKNSFKILDFYVSDINSIKVRKITKKGFYFQSERDIFLNEVEISKDVMYKVTYEKLDRSSNNGDEYFMQKSLLKYLDSSEEDLKVKISKIVNGDIYERL